MERMMKIQEVLLRAMAKKITWWQAAEIIGVSARTIWRWRERLEEHGYDGLADRRIHAILYIDLRFVRTTENTFRVGLDRFRWRSVVDRHFPVTSQASA